MRGLTEEAAAVAIDVATRVLHLPTVRTSADELAAAAVRDRLTHRAYLAELLAAEVDDREARRRERRIAEVRFPRMKHLAEFDLGATPSIEPAALATLAQGAWIEAGEPVVLLGDSGTGKTHLLADEPAFFSATAVRSIDPASMTLWVRGVVRRYRVDAQLGLTIGPSAKPGAGTLCHPRATLGMSLLKVMPLCRFARVRPTHLLENGPTRGATR